ncbi:MAG: hypothetical protein FJ279_31390 [Planctomycetes bacterium]|nr:hypothetical protein [Planctomycetota bacterium]
MNNGSRNPPNGGPDLTTKQQAVLAAGKLRRLFYARFKPEYITDSLQRRRGECIRCGACCKLMYACPFLNNGNGVTYTCVKHPKHFVTCRIFPVDESDLRDRDIIAPERKCGFHFEPDGRRRKHRSPR